jgi:type I restriction enzyme R subunit
MNEAETRAEKIDPLLKQCGWGVQEGSKILREYKLTAGRLQPGGGRQKSQIADYILEYKGRKLAVIEAKSDETPVAEGVAQAKEYATRLNLAYTYAANGNQIYQVCMTTGEERLVGEFPPPETLWQLTFNERNEWREKFDLIPFEFTGMENEARYYQEVAVNNAMKAIADGKKRILLTLATGTGKTFIAFQIVWKLFQTRWNLMRDGKRRPRVLFLADRNLLADHAFNDFGAFEQDALVRIRPGQIRKHGRVPKNGSIFFTIFQTFMTGNEAEPYYFGYEPDFFDMVIIDECHRGGANDESNWRAIMEYFSPAVQIGLTATPRRDENADTYQYFGEPVYTYSLRQGVDDGYLTPFRVKRIETDIDTYTYEPDDKVLEGEIDPEKLYKEPDFNHIIEIKERETKRVKIYLDDVDQREKAIVFCATQDHAAGIRDLINQLKTNPNPLYCARVTANDGELGEQHLRNFQDNERSIPTVLTTSQKLSTGVDARNIRNIVLLRPIGSMIEFKQIIGRGTRLFENKQFFTIYDFVDACNHFTDPEWDGEPEPPVEKPVRKTPADKSDNDDDGSDNGEDDIPHEKQIARVRLADGKERLITFTKATFFYGADGQLLTAEQFIESLYGKIPTFFKDEEDLRRLWSNPTTRKSLLKKLSDAGYGQEELKQLQKLINAENSDIFDVLEYVAFAVPPIPREVRVERALFRIFQPLNHQQREFIAFVLSNYIQAGVEEISEDKLSELLKLKYHALRDALQVLGNIETIRAFFFDFQRNLYAETVK